MNTTSAVSGAAFAAEVIGPNFVVPDDSTVGDWVVRTSSVIARIAVNHENFEKETMVAVIQELARKIPDVVLVPTVEHMKKVMEEAGLLTEVPSS